ncbi:MAG: YiiX/YebB-like N1pC/P60 family cysteine hydrolase [Bythopirellula sp.]
MSIDQQLSPQTVAHLSEHMSRLKEAATQFRQSTNARDRGYFSPTEDDQVLHLWVSYHMTRNALFELTTPYRDDAAAAEKASLTDFAVAYAAAIILVDAARSIRELFADEPIIRRKLNEAYELYGIPEGSFDAIQMSLSDPGNVLQVYQANQVFDENATAIRNDDSLAEVQRIIDLLGERVRVSPTAYAKARANERARDFYDTIVHSGLGQAIYAIQSWVSRWVGQLSMHPSHRPALPESIKADFLKVLQPGDVLVTRKEHSFTNYFLPGYWPHVALYIGAGQVIEALADGVRLRSVESPFAVDALAAIRPLLSTDQVAEAIQRAHTHVGKPYDFDFDFTRADRMVCTEVVYRSYAGIGDVQFDLTRRAARHNLSAEDLLNLARQRKFFENLAIFCPNHCPKLLCDQQQEAVLRATMDG